jgi:hypothetical protein
VFTLQVVRDIVSAAERHDNKALLEILDDPVFSKHYDLSDLGMSGESLVRACAVGNIIGAQAILEHKAPANIYNGKALHKYVIVARHPSAPPSMVPLILPFPFPQSVPQPAGRRHPAADALQG